MSVGVLIADISAIRPPLPVKSDNHGDRMPTPKISKDSNEVLRTAD